jgi:hypothetical protein
MENVQHTFVKHPEFFFFKYFNDFILFFLFSEVIFDKKRHLIGEEFFRHPVPNSESNKSVDHISAAEDLTRIPTIVSPSKYET